ncbi:hypothetical protein E2C01_044072 [Portunus trituberculatus]|uniref:Uncharacterized protein n=1 Tax=Portunus trituberculatus TaxID=210409 RepID=A0A5B7FZE6_PORTR|nr:hypothetical protein [Portunus trituberculatus]
MATPTQASESPCREGTRSDCSSGSDPKCLDTFLNFICINFCNFRGLRSNFQFEEHHHFSVKTPFPY